ncbi:MULTISPECIES: hypothetical protein [unclassified Pseudomonas]|uniref:hypothetical protein n=1 Tax=unclassified Pseudomonas TaxID=196821 RepID=UPI000488030E|nr:MULTISPECIES: hypothetical protein [unclassified Pseudomonas]
MLDPNATREPGRTASIGDNLEVLPSLNAQQISAYPQPFEPSPTLVGSQLTIAQHRRVQHGRYRQANGLAGADRCNPQHFLGRIGDGLLDGSSHFHRYLCAGLGEQHTTGLGCACWSRQRGGIFQPLQSPVFIRLLLVANPRFALFSVLALLLPACLPRLPDLLLCGMFHQQRSRAL